MKGSGTDDVLTALETAKAQHPDLADLFEFQRELTAAILAVEVSLPPLQKEYPAEKAVARWQAGRPALTFDDLNVDWPVFDELLAQVNEIAGRYRPEWVTDANLSVRVSPETVRAWYDNATPVDERTAFLLTNTLRPFLTPLAQAVRPHLNGFDWYPNTCPVCGGPPDLATLEQKSGARQLICSRCDTDWRYRRVGCPYCGNEDPRQLAYYLGDDETYRLYVCEACRRYLKTVDWRQTFAYRLLPVERVLSVGMDIAAVKAGYSGPRS